MSLWLRIHDEDGKTHYVSVPFEPLCFVTWVGLGIGLLLPWIHMFRVAVVTSPVPTSLACVSVLIVGWTFFALSKISVMRTGHLVSFGSGGMSPTMQFSYRLGYALMALAAIAVLLFCRLAVSAV